MASELRNLPKECKSEALSKEGNPLSTIVAVFFACFSAIPLGLVLALFLGTLFDTFATEPMKRIPLQSSARPPWSQPR